MGVAALWVGGHSSLTEVKPTVQWLDVSRKRESSMSLARSVLFVVLAALSPQAAEAAPIFYAIAGASGTDFATLQTDGETLFEHSTDTLGPARVSLPGASGFSSVTDGVLRAYATTDGTRSSVNATTSYFDTLLLESETLPSGTVVQLRAELLFTRSVTPNGVPAGSPCSGAAVAYAGIDAGTNAGSAGNLLVQDHHCDITDINEPLGVFTGVIGEEMTINAYLTAAVGAFLPGTADASHTLSFLLTPIGDFTYRTASGNSYVDTRQTPSVPEPAIVLLLSGAMALTAAHRRRVGRR